MLYEDFEGRPLRELGCHMARAKLFGRSQSFDAECQKGLCIFLGLQSTILRVIITRKKERVFVW